MKMTMVKFLFLSIIMFGYLCRAAYWPQVSGDPSKPIWTVYLLAAEIDGQPLGPGDEISVFDGERLVGSTQLQASLSGEIKATDTLLAWSVIDDEGGYTPANPFTVKVWRAATDREYVVAVDFHDFGDPALYTGDSFGTGNRNSVASLFEGFTESGIPFSWLFDHELPTDGSMDHVRIGDSPFTVREEWLAGTNPHDITDILRLIEPPVRTPEGFRVSWRSVATRTYTIERSRDLTGDPQFTSVATGIQGVDGVSEYIDETADETGTFFYRVLVEQ